MNNMPLKIIHGKHSIHIRYLLVVLNTMFARIEYFYYKLTKVKECCKDCRWLTETTFKRNDKIIYYCNNLMTSGSMEKTIDFVKCKLFDKIT